MFTCAARRCLTTMRRNTRGLLLHRFPSAAAAISTTTARNLPPSNAAAMPQQERAAVEKLLDLCCAQQQHQQQHQKVNDLDRAGHAVQHHLTEAQLCIEDCYHETENLPQELEAAEHALEQACAAMVDFLDILRSNESSNVTDNNNNNNQWLDLRRNQVAQFKGLRQQLYALQKHPQDQTE